MFLGYLLTFYVFVNVFDLFLILRGLSTSYMNTLYIGVNILCLNWSAISNIFLTHILMVPAGLFQPDPVPYRHYTDLIKFIVRHV